MIKYLFLYQILGPNQSVTEGPIEAKTTGMQGQLIIVSKTIETTSDREIKEDQISQNVRTIVPRRNRMLTQFLS